MPLERRPTEEGLVEKERSLSLIREELAAAQMVADLGGNPAWVAIEKDLRDRIAAVDEVLEDFEKLPTEMRAIMLKERKDLRFFASTVERAQERVVALNQSLGFAIEARDRYRGRANG